MRGAFKKSIWLFTLLALLGCVTAKSDNDKVSLSTASDAARNYFLEGRDIFEKLRGQEARSYFEKAVAEDPDFAMAHLYLSFTQPSATAFFASLKKATSLAEQASEGERLWILGFEAGVQGNPAQQRAHYQKLAELYPNDERALTLLGNHYFGQQMWEAAIAEYEKAIRINPQFSQPYNQLGYAYRFLENYEDSEKTFKKYIEVIPDDPNPYDSYAELLLKMGRYDAAIENYRKALSVNANFPASHIGIATCYNLKGEHSKARAQLQKLYDTAKDDGQRRAALFAMTVSYVDEGNLQGALQSLNRQYEIAEEIQDSAAMAGDLGTMGTILLEFGRPDAALEKFEASLKAMRESNLAQEQKDLAEQGHLFSLTRVAVQNGDLPTARKHAATYRKQAEARNNRFQIWAAHQLAGEIAMAENNYQTAAAEFEQSNLQNPFNIYKCAMAYKHQGDSRKAEEMFEKAKNFNALNSLAYAFARNQKESPLSNKY